MKRCTKCGEEKPVDQFYWKYQTGRNGKKYGPYPQHPCKKCKNAHDNAYVKVYYASHVEQRKAYNEAYYQEHKEDYKAYQQGWRRTNPKVNKELHIRRKMRKKGAFVEDTPLKEIYERDGGTCGICQNPVSFIEATIDHVIPLSRGGEHSRANVRIAHGPCNSKKGSKLDDEMR